ncbi:MAG: hypothetical protein KDK90_06520 [Leptospiraceae bacterium]|nr:hypothetical protein [Leptospiraceae bacterium]
MKDLEGLGPNEIAALISKIRIEYRTLSTQNSKIFRVDQFEERYKHILNEKGNIQQFLKDEINFLEKLKTIHKHRKAKEEAAKGETINKIIEDQESKFKKYKKIEFHPLAKDEIKYFYGAIADFTKTELQFVIHIFRGTPEMSSLQDSIALLERLGTRKFKQHSIRIAEHVRTLVEAKGNQTILEQDVQKILKENCYSLNKVAEVVNGCLLNKRVSYHAVLGFNKADYPDLHEKYEGITHVYALEMVIFKAREIISDFRMDSIIDFKQKFT